MNEEQWQKTKNIVDKRDKRSCQFLKCLTLTEASLLKRGQELSKDRCHIFSRSSRPDLKYNPDNIITLCRFIHRRMDNYQDPITGQTNMDINYHFYWWWRIKNKKREKYNSSIDYEELLLSQMR